MGRYYRRKLFAILAAVFLIYSFPSKEIAYAQSNDPIEVIATAADLQKIRNDPDGNFILEADISLSGTFTPINAFSGVLDGQGYTISGMTLNASSNLTSVAFIIANTGTIRNLGFKDVKITGISGDKNCWAAAIAATNAGTIEGCYVTGTIAGGYRSGGICAHNQGTVKNCYAVATISAYVECGEIAAVAEADSIIDSCYTIPNVLSAVNNTGGIAAYGYTGTVVKNCAVLTGTITNTKNENIARIVGRLKGTPTFQNNIASSATLINGTAVSSGTLTDKNGLNRTGEDLLLQTTFEIDLGWDFTKVWKYDSTLGRPVLRTAEERRNQNVYYNASTNSVDVANIPSNTSGVAYQGKILRSVFSTVLITVDQG